MFRIQPNQNDIRYVNATNIMFLIPGDNYYTRIRRGKGRGRGGERKRGGGGEGRGERERDLLFHFLAKKSYDIVDRQGAINLSTKRVNSNKISASV